MSQADTKVLHVTLEDSQENNKKLTPEQRQVQRAKENAVPHKHGGWTQ